MAAERSEEYSAVRSSALGMMEKAAQVQRKDLEFAFAAIAADCSYFHSRIPGVEEDKVLLLTLLDLLKAVPLLQYSIERVWSERLVSLTGATVDSAMGKFRKEQEEFDAVLKLLASVVERWIPADFEYDFKQLGDRRKAIRNARELAWLSFRHGNPPLASARLATAEKWAKELGDLDLSTSLISDRYLGEERAGASPEHLRRLRDEALSRAQTLRAQYRTRAGRIWASYRADELYGAMLKGQFADNTSDQHGRVFNISESLKARMLLDRLTMPQTMEVESEQARQLEHRILTYEKPPSEGDLAMEELRLVSQMTGFGVCGANRESGNSTLQELEGIYAKAGAGFMGSAATATVADVQRKLQPGEALLEYSIPFNELHPAQELWATLITPERVLASHVNLDKVLGIAPMTGRMCIDGQPPVDSSALGNLLLDLRIDIRTQQDETAKRRLRRLHQILIEPLLAQGVQFERFTNLIVVPHSILHYVPFPALIDAAGKYLIEKTALVIAPSASVWKVVADRSSSADRFTGFANPLLKDPLQADLRYAELELSEIIKAAPAKEMRAFPRHLATKDRLEGEAENTSILHIATHGEFPDEKALDLHSIWLRDASGNGTKVGSAEIRKLKLANARLVVLNVCSGGLYRIGPSDEPYGLMPAFLEAGAQNVLSTLWPMQDRFGRNFMVEYYKHLAEGPTKAHQRTCQRFLAARENIREWAGYILVGSGR